MAEYPNVISFVRISNHVCCTEIYIYTLEWYIGPPRSRSGGDCMVVGFTTTCTIRVYHH